MAGLIAAIDQGTTSTRCILFDVKGNIIAQDQKEHGQMYPQAGYVEHDPMEILINSRDVFRTALAKSHSIEKDILAIGITNQRETTVVWDRTTGKPFFNAIVWQDTRTADICTELSKDGGQDRFRDKVGLPLATYFSGPKIKWILDHVPGVRKAAEKGLALFGNIDSWLIWNLTGGPNGGVHATDPSNASRTMLMDLVTLEWDTEILRILGIPASVLPKIMPSSHIYGYAKDFNGIPIAGVLGDQQAALFGQTCFSAGEAKNTYGTGCFMLLNTGDKIIPSQSGLLTTVGYKIGSKKPAYCLEGSIAITGALVQWLRDNLNMIETSSDIEFLARTVENNGGVYFVPAFSGLFAPHWRSDARGIIAGLTRYVNKGHIARAALEATAFQTREVLDAMEIDSGVKLTSLKVDGGMVYNELLMQFQADILNVPVVRPVVAETTALGAAYAAGLAVGLWSSEQELRVNWGKDREWIPQMDAVERDQMYNMWKKAVSRTLGWLN